MSTSSSAAVVNSSCQATPQSHLVGLGTFLVPRDQVDSTIRTAIRLGYRRIDCAPVYFNEDVIGDTLQSILTQEEQGSTAVVRREDLYLVSKLPSPLHRNVEGAVRKTLADLRTDYLDLYLIHWPVAFLPVPIPPATVRGWENEDIDDSDGGRRIDPTVSIHETWSAMERLVEMGLVKEIGVSNFPVMLLHELLSRAKIVPAVNQCEGHPYLAQTKLIQYCQARGIHFQAYSPLGTAGYKDSQEPAVLQDAVLVELAQQHQLTVAQIVLLWALQRGTSVVVKSCSEDHLRENLQLVDLYKQRKGAVLSEEEMERINHLNRNYRFFRPEDWWSSMGMAVFD